jgi:hypothetical protein
MNRTDLLSRLNIVAPALASNRLIPVLTHFWFYGDKVMAFNDQIAISTPLETPFKGAVPGETLLDLLDASRALDVEFAATDRRLLVKAGRTRFRLGLLPSENFAFDMPEPAEVTLPCDLNALVAALRCCIGSVSNDMTVPDQLGVTLLPDGDRLLLFSTDGLTMTRAHVKLTGEFGPRAILSGAFCKLLIKLGDEIDLLQIKTGKQNYSLARAGETVVCGPLVEVDNPVPYQEMFAHHVSEDELQSLYQIPVTLERILQRALIITDTPNDQTSTDIAARDGIVRFYSRSGQGGVTVTDKLLLGSQPDVQIRLRAKYVKMGLDNGFDHMLLSERCLIMRRGQIFYLVAGMDP